MRLHIGRDEPPVYPPTISASVRDQASGDELQLLARRTGATDEQGCEEYVIGQLDGSPIPWPGSWFTSGRVILHLDLLPARSAMRFLFERKEPEA